MKNPVPPVRATSPEAGFTILELLIAMAVLAILVGVGVPSFNAIIRQNRLASHSNELLSAAAIARSEAVKRGAVVTMCATTDGATCATANDHWSDGWIVFADDNGPAIGTIDGNDEVIQRWPSSTPQRIAISASANAQLFISYRGDGATTLPRGDQAVFTVVPQDCTNPNGARSVTVMAVGRASATRRNCP